MRPGSFPVNALSVFGQRRVYLADPGEDAAAYVHSIGEAGVLHDRQALGRARAALAVQHDPLVLRQLLERRPGEELTLGDERGPWDGHDLVLVGLPDVDEEDV